MYVVFSLYFVKFVRSGGSSLLNLGARPSVRVGVGSGDDEGQRPGRESREVPQKLKKNAYHCLCVNVLLRMQSYM